MQQSCHLIVKRMFRERPVRRVHGILERPVHYPGKSCETERYPKRALSTHIAVFPQRSRIAQFTSGRSRFVYNTNLMRQLYRDMLAEKTLAKAAD
jgi:hypothetical protein